MYAGCPILWVRITTSNESCIKFNRAEYIALSQATRNLIPFMNLVEDILLILSIDYIIQEVQYKNTKTASNISADVYEDNSGALELTKVPKMRPWTKHIALKYHHFWEHVRDGRVQIHPIATREQITNIFTKALVRDSFIYLREKLCGWWLITPIPSHEGVWDSYLWNPNEVTLICITNS